ncbi:hypothetical protein CLV43_1011128 [Umezawaea tangerina]|uniref:Uncharacterized protein n=1 Tax=Umezawaea tangerina TaxID=84725 RepID=A0A2T0TMH8_9PSEU|nr:hypothetical protein CLV43_1011128 [Umezawaea tangerina]
MGWGVRSLGGGGGGGAEFGGRSRVGRHRGGWSRVGRHRGGWSRAGRHRGGTSRTGLHSGGTPELGLTTAARTSPPKPWVPPGPAQLAAQAPGLTAVKPVPAVPPRGVRTRPPHSWGSSVSTVPPREVRTRSLPPWGSSVPAAPPREVRTRSLPPWGSSVPAAPPREVRTRSLPPWGSSVPAAPPREVRTRSLPPWGSSVPAAPLVGLASGPPNVRSPAPGARLSQCLTPVCQDDKAVLTNRGEAGGRCVSGAGGDLASPDIELRSTRHPRLRRRTRHRLAPIRPQALRAGCALAGCAQRGGGWLVGGCRARCVSGGLLADEDFAACGAVGEGVEHVRGGGFGA